MEIEKKCVDLEKWTFPNVCWPLYDEDSPKKLVSTHHCIINHSLSPFLLNSNRLSEKNSCTMLQNGTKVVVNKDIEYFLRWFFLCQCRGRFFASKSGFFKTRKGDKKVGESNRGGKKLVEKEPDDKESLKEKPTTFLRDCFQVYIKRHCVATLKMECKINNTSFIFLSGMLRSSFSWEVLCILHTNVAKS